MNRPSRPTPEIVAARLRVVQSRAERARRAGELAQHADLTRRAGLLQESLKSLLALGAGEYG
jgi:hypothetical protein